MFQNWLKEDRILVKFIIAIFICLGVGWLLYGLFGYQLIKSMYESKLIFRLGAFVSGEPAVLQSKLLGYYLEKINLLVVSLARNILLLTFVFVLTAKTIVSIPKQKLIFGKNYFNNIKHVFGVAIFKNSFKDHRPVFIFILCILSGWLFFSLFGYRLLAHEEVFMGIYPLIDYIIKGILILAIFLLFVSSDRLKSVLFLLFSSTAILYLKINPVLIPLSFGEYYAEFASSLKVIQECVSTRWLAPYVSHYLGFNSSQGWLIFSLLTFLIGISYLYLGVYRLTKDNKFAFITAFIPVATTTGWFNVYVPGQLDWPLFMLLVFSFFVRKDLYSLIFATFAIFIHERSAFIVLFLPFMRALLNREFDKKIIFKNFAIISLIIVCFFVFKRYFSMGKDEYTGIFYLKGFLRGRAQFAGYRENLVTVLIVIFEAYKAVIFFCLFCFIALLKSKFPYKKFAIFLIITLFYFIPLQLLIAIDSVRLMDILFFPILLLILICHYEVIGFRGLLFAFLIASLCINQFLPVKYRSQSANYFPCSVINNMWRKNYNCGYLNRNIGVIQPGINY